MIPSEHRTQFLCRQRYDLDDLAPSGQPCPFRRASVTGLDQHGGPSGLEPFARLLEAAHRLTRPAREAYLVAQATFEAILDPGAKVWGQMHLATGRPGKGAPAHGAF